jgi:starvation-inducible outer membrane lipoprotein
MKNYLLIACLALTACSNVPPMIENPPLADITYQQVLANIDNYKNAPVRWGGTIIEVENEPTFSAIQILLPYIPKIPQSLSRGLWQAIQNGLLGKKLCGFHYWL